MSNPAHKTLIATVGRTNISEIRVSLNLDNGRRLVDVRTYEEPSNGDGEKFATNKGMCLTPEKLDDLIQALQAAAIAAKDGLG